jgi:transcription elongation GreA/GreB family factor
VGLGTRVKVTDLSTSSTDTFSILGAWDSDPDRGIVSYLTPLAQALMNKKVGEDVEFEMDGSRKRYRIESIEAAQAAPQPPAEVPVA